MIQQRLGEFAGILLVGDGVVGMLQPERHTRLWLSGPAPYRAVMEPFVRHPGMTRAIAVAEAAAGLWLASRQRRSERRR
jgi:hypothetical protein